MKNQTPQLYQQFTESELDTFLKTLKSSIANEPLVEVKEDDLFGDFIIIAGYKFKKVYSHYQCLQTPTERHQKIERIMPKAKNDYYKK